MNISSVSSQAMVLKEQMTKSQLGIEMLKQQADAQQKLVSMLDQQSRTVAPSINPQEGGFSTYA